MKKILLLVFSLLVLGTAINSAEAAKKKVHTIGDSTMANYATDGSTEKRGWAQMLQQFFDSDRVTVNNRGKSGASSKSFYKEAAYWPTLAKGGSDQMQSGDFLLIQFAHNDEKTNGTDGDELKAYYNDKGDAASANATDYRGTTAFDTYKKYIRAYINEAKSMGVTPIVVGPIARKYFSGNDISRSGRHDLGDKFNVIKDGALLTNQSVPASDDTYDYVESAKAVAAEYDDVPFIDLTTLTADLYIKYGEQYCTDYLFNKDQSAGKTGDSTHPNALGATLIAREFVKQLVSQANTETDAKKKAVLMALADDVVLSSEITFNPTSGDMGDEYVGAEVVREFNVSAFGLASAEGEITFTTTEGFEVSADNEKWAKTIKVSYQKSTLTTTIYVRGTAESAELKGKLTASDGTNEKSLDLRIGSISIPGGISTSASWSLTSSVSPNANDAVTLSDETFTGAEVKQYGGIGTDTNKRTMQLIQPAGGAWGVSEIDEVSTRYIQFKLTVPEGKAFYANKISYYVAAQGGSAVSYHAYYSTNPNFSEQTLIDEKVNMPKATPTLVEKKLAKRIEEGESLYIRLYPWYHNQSSAATGKYLCISDMTIDGTIADAVIETTFGIGRELKETTFAAGQETITGTIPQGATVEQISTCDYPGTNQTLYHGNKTTAYTAPNVWRNYWNADPSGKKTVQNAYADGFYWGFKVTVPDGKALNVSKIYSDVYGVKNTLTSKFVVKASLAGNPIYTSGNHAANVESGDACAFTEDVAANENLQGLTGDIYFLMPWYSGSSATYYALKDFNITATLTNAQQTTKHSLTTTVSPAEAGSVIVDPDGTSFAEDKEVTLSAKRNFGYKFKEWQVDGTTVSTDSDYKVTMDADKSVTAVFETVPVYSVSTTCTNDAERSLGSITLTPNEHNGKYEAGTEVTAVANESKIIKFMQWTDGGENAGTSATRTFTVKSDMNITASYEVQDFIAVFDASGVQGYASNSSYPFAADLVWDGDRNASAQIVRVSDGAAVKGTSGTPVVRNRTKVVIDGINGLYQNGYRTTDIAWQYQFSTKGFTAATFTADMCAKNAATKQFKAQYSVDGQSFIDLSDPWECSTSVLRPLSFELPAEAIGQELVYVRITGVGTDVFNTNYAFSSTDAESGLAYTTNSESGVGNVYVMGVAQVATDESAPVATSTLPVDGADGVSASGTITITYDERIQEGAGNGVATLDGTPMTPTWNTRSVSFPYVALEYGKTYTFTMPAGFVADRSGNNADAVEITFTVMDRQKPEARIFDAVVDASLEELSHAEGNRFFEATETMPRQYRYIQDAIDDAPETNIKPYLIYIKEGYYNDGNETFASSYGTRYTTSDTSKDAPTERIAGGKNQYDDCRLVYVNKPNIHIIGQDVDKVTIATDRLDGAVSGNASRVWYHVNAGAALEVQEGATDFFMQGITIDNENWTISKMEGPQALCMNIVSDRAVFDNINARSYQDTYKSNGLYNRQYFNNSVIEGGVDFIYGNGDVWFEGCTLNINRKAGGWIVAPDHPADTRWGYVFNNTRITTTYAANPEDFQISLGRPWHENPKTVFLHTQMEVKPIAGYWSATMGTNTGLPAIWAVYDIKDKNGVQLSDESISEYYYTDDNGNKVYGTAKNSLTADEVAEYTVTNVMKGDGTSAATGVWNPQLVVEKTDVPVLSEDSGVITWDADDYAICYVVTVNGKPVAFTTATSYNAQKDDVITVQSVNEHGALSAMSEAITASATATPSGITSTPSQRSNEGAYNLAGQRVNTLSCQHGVFIINGRKVMK